ncbi:MAG: NUDIX domain-containing protein [Opitutae bacterium]|nr:NUDIX domain-containing protein [Opitutae bacterium]
MKAQRISAGAIVVKDGKVLLVRHRKEGAYDFLVAPGGGVGDGEDAAAAAVREAKEEAGVTVHPVKLAFVEEFFSPVQRECKLWFWCRYLSGAPNAEAHEATREYICEAAFFSREDLVSHTVFPPVLKHDAFWEAERKGFPTTEYLGLRAMEFS